MYCEELNECKYSDYFHSRMSLYRVPHPSSVSFLRFNLTANFVLKSHWCNHLIGATMELSTYKSSLQCNYDSVEIIHGELPGLL